MKISVPLRKKIFMNMIKRSLVVMMLLVSLFAVAQEDTTATKKWKKGGDFSLNLNQITFSNWAAGGDNSMSAVAFLNYGIDYANGKHSWKNKFIVGYGMQYIKEDYKKTEDKIDLSSMYGYSVSKWLDFSMLAYFRTQATEGYDSFDNKKVVSTFMAPAYVGVGPGISYKPTDYFSAFISPTTAQWLFVLDDNLSAVGAYGVEAGKKSKFQFGASAKLHFKKDIAKNVNLESILNLFSDYLSHPENILVNWDVIVNMGINSWLSTKLTTNLIYDHNADIFDKDGNNIGPKTQFKEMFGIGIGFKI